MNNSLMPELQDIINRIHAFNRIHKEGVFIYNFIGFKDNPEEICEECGEHHALEVDENKSISGAYGEIDDIRQLLNMLRDIVEDEKDEDGFVNL